MKRSSSRRRTTPHDCFRRLSVEKHRVDDVLARKKGLGFYFTRNWRYSVPMSRQELVRAKREQILSVARKHGAVSVKLFGSAARGDGVDSSDLDFVVELEPGRSLLDLGGLQADLERLLGCAVDVVTVKGLRERIRARVLAEAVPV
jgi:predicted nucleotidyltransferase